MYLYSNNSTFPFSNLAYTGFVIHSPIKNKWKGCDGVHLPTCQRRKNIKFGAEFKVNLETYPENMWVILVVKLR